MTNTLPSYITNGGGHIFATPTMPSGQLPGDIVVAVFAEGDSTAGNTYSVNAPWSIIAQVTRPDGTNPIVVAWSYVPVSGSLVAPTFTPSGSHSSFGSIAFLFRNAKIGAAIGNQAVNSSNSASNATVGSISASAGNSLAVLVTRGGVSSWPPSGWVSADTQANNGIVGVATMALTNQGDATGSVTSALSGAQFFDELNFELQGYQSPIPGDKYFNGLPYPGISR